VAQDFTSSAILYTVTAEDGTTKDYLVTVKLNTEIGKSSAKDITAFSVAGVVGVITGSNIVVTVPFGTDVTALVPTIEVSAGASVSPASGVAQDFTSPAILYTVTAEDGSIKDYITYYIGDTGPAGGIVFYDRGRYTTGLTPNWRYMEAAPVDQGTTTQAWSNINNVLIGTTSKAIGSGQANTLAIINQLGHLTSAAKLCDDLIIGSYSDWFLPSKGELFQMYSNLSASGIGGFVLPSAYYWSSSEDSATTAWKQQFFTGGATAGAKSTTANSSVRCARAF
jgi:hypothetical protein